MPFPRIPLRVVPDRRDVTGRPRARINGILACLFGAGPSRRRWTTSQDHHFVLAGERLYIRRVGASGSPPRSCSAPPFRPDSLDGAWVAGLTETCAAVPMGVLLSPISWGLLPMQDGLPSETRLYLHDARTFSISGRVLLDLRLLPRVLVAWLGPAAVPLMTPWRLGAAIETVAEEPARARPRLPRCAHGRATAAVTA